MPQTFVANALIHRVVNIFLRGLREFVRRFLSNLGGLLAFIGGIDRERPRNLQQQKKRDT